MRLRRVLCLSVVLGSGMLFSGGLVAGQAEALVLTPRPSKATLMATASFDAGGTCVPDMDAQLIYHLLIPDRLRLEDQERSVVQVQSLSVEELRDEAGAPVGIPARLKRHTSMVIPRPARSQISTGHQPGSIPLPPLTLPMPNRAATAFALVRGTVDLELAIGDPVVLTLTPADCLANRTTGKEGLSPKAVTVVSRDAETITLRCDRTANARLREVRFLDPEGKALPVQSRTPVLSGGNEDWAIAFRVRMTAETSIVLEFYPPLTSHRLPFIMERLVIPDPAGRAPITTLPNVIAPPAVTPSPLPKSAG